VQNKELLTSLISVHSGKNEPPLPGLVSKSFVFVNTTGLRETSEILLLELFRELFFEKFSGSKSSVLLDPERKNLYSVEEKAVLYLTRGRSKKNKIKDFSGYYAPAYPSLARGAWLRQKSDRQLRDTVFRGFIAQSLRDNSGQELLDISKKLVSAFVGYRSIDVSGIAEIEILSAALSNSSFDKDEFDLLGASEATTKLENILFEAISGSKEQSYTFKSSFFDSFALTLTQDLIAICELEKKAPRLQWLEIVKCYLRVSICSWVLAKMKITVWLRDEILKVLENHDYLPDEKLFNDFLKNRNLNLFSPSSSATDGPNVHVDVYVRARVELTVLCFMLQSVGGIDDLDKYELVATDKGGKKIPVIEFITLFANLRNGIEEIIAPLTLRQWLLRTCEKFSAWTSPRKKGQGKNLDEFLRVLARSSEGDGDTGYLVTPIRRGSRTMNYSIFPGPMLIKTIAYLASQKKKKLDLNTKKKSGRMVLSDLENHFRIYGIEFGMTAGARQKLITELQSLGLLVGSPDAGDSVSVKTPF